MSASPIQTSNRRTWKFPGGLHVDDHKAEPLKQPIGVAPIPKRLILPLAQHIGAPAVPCVSVGDQVLKGQTIATADGYVSAPIHASSSGIVVAIEPHPIAHPSGLETDCIIIETDGEDRALAEPEWQPTPNYGELDAAELRQIVRKAGITGLGGASFPSFIKLNPGPNRLIETLVLNGAECEPYIACDQAVMAERAGEIIAGAQLIQYAIGAPECLIGVEDNKPEAIAALQAVAADETGIEIVVLPTRYPQGGEKQLIQALTGKQVPSQGLPLDVGIVCHNVATAAAVWRAVVHAEPLISRVMTITGKGVGEARNLQVRIGTPVADLIEYCGGYRDVGRLVMGGPMMGFALQSDSVPVVKATNCILAVPQAEAKPEEPAMPCIRCSACADDCPASLLPQQMYWYARDKDFDKAQEYNLFDCIECGVCAQVCPSHIPLVQYFRFAKTEIWKAEREKQQSDIARQRHESRKERLEREAAEAEARRAAKRKSLKPGKADTSTADQSSTSSPAQQQIQDAVARAKAKKAAAASGETTKTAAPQSAVQAAIAKAKARQQDEDNSESQNNETKDKPMSAAAAAIARAKNKTEDQPAVEAKTDNAEELTGAAAIIARAKAQKSDQKADQTEPAPESADQTPEHQPETAKKLSPAQAAIARAKARTNSDTPNTNTPGSSDTTTTPEKTVTGNNAAAIIARAKNKAGGSETEAQASGPAQPTSVDDSTSDILIKAITAAKANRQSTQEKCNLAPGQVPEQPFAHLQSPASASQSVVAEAIAAAKEQRQSKAGNSSLTVRVAPGVVPDPRAKAGKESA